MLHHRSQRETARGAKGSDNSDHDAHRSLPTLSLADSHQRLARDRRNAHVHNFRAADLAVSEANVLCSDRRAA
jgi:hypothetical protein